MPHKILILKIFAANFFGLLVTYLISFFTPLTWWLVAVGLFVGVDFITGILKSKKQGEEIKSKKMFTTVTKFIAYGLGIIVAHSLSLLFFPDFPAVKLIAGFVAFIEVKSLDENIKGITGFSLFGDILKMLNPKNKNNDSNPGEKVNEDPAGDKDKPNTDAAV